MILNNFAERLKEERSRLGLSQAELGELCGVKKLAQFNYEKGDRFPDANYLMLATRIGIDVNYLLTGHRTASVLPTDESLILEKYRQADAAIKNKVLILLLSGDNIDSASQVFHGDVGQVNKIDKNEGGITQRVGSFIKK